MVGLPNSVAYCVKEKKACVGWVEKNFKDCLCNLNDELSFAFGLISLVCWGVAEVPQIITNFRTKSSHGVSLAFLLTWVAGDIFNLVGCLLEPATLPTQFYTALLYTISTVVLVLQSIYYDHFYAWLKPRRIDNNQGVEEKHRLLKSPKQAGTGIPIPGSTPKQQPHREFYYTSARSLASSSTPTTWSYLRTAKSGPTDAALEYDDPSSEDETIQVPSKKSLSIPKPIPKSRGSGALIFAAAASLPHGSKAMMEVYKGLTGRRLLAEHSMESNGYGQWLGWLMAAIYMGGRIPQIWLNIKRGSVEGLNPLMFIFALIANATYVGSIVVRTSEWDKLKANLPWLLDAVVCVLLDLLIIFQYVYYRYIQKRIPDGREECGSDYYVEADKVPLS